MAILSNKELLAGIAEELKKIASKERYDFYRNNTYIIEFTKGVKEVLKRAFPEEYDEIEIAVSEVGDTTVNVGLSLPDTANIRNFINNYNESKKGD